MVRGSVDRSGCPCFVEKVTDALITMTTISTRRGQDGCQVVKAWMSGRESMDDRVSTEMGNLVSEEINVRDQRTTVSRSARYRLKEADAVFSMVGTTRVGMVPNRETILHQHLSPRS